MRAVRISVLSYIAGGSLVWLALAASQAAGVSNFSQPERAALSAAWPASVALLVMDALVDHARYDYPD